MGRLAGARTKSAPQIKETFMKLILLAAVAAIASPAIAQQTPAGSTDATSTQTDTATAPASGASTSAPMTTGSGDPVGGYQPTAPAVSGGTPGASLPPTFQAAPSPDQAYPAPAPLAKYPVCKKGQYDKCIQRGGK